MIQIKPTKVDALRSLTTGSISYDDNCVNVTYLEGQTPVPKADIDAKYNSMISEWEAQEYARNRATEYPALAEQLDEIFHNGIDSWKAVIKVTKDKYPKG